MIAGPFETGEAFILPVSDRRVRLTVVDTSQLPAGYLASDEIQQHPW